MKVNDQELNVSNEMKSKIDNMSHYEMAHSHRFSPNGDPLHQGDVGKYFSNVFQNKFGGFTPQISKQLGWK